MLRSLGGRSESCLLEEFGGRLVGELADIGAALRSPLHVAGFVVHLRECFGWEGLQYFQTKSRCHRNVELYPLL
jgi:hypothetical protein